MSIPILYIKAARFFGAGCERGIPDEARIREIRKQYSLRRSDRFTSLAVAAVRDESGDGFPSGFSADSGLLTVSAFGPHKTVFATLDDILDYPEDLILPTRFTHSVENAAASYLGTILGITGPTYSFTGFESAWFETLEFAYALLRVRACPSVLLIAVEERGMLTAAAPGLDPARFPVEPEEFVAALHLTGDPEPGACALTLDRSAEIPDAPGFPLGCSPARMAGLLRSAAAGAAVIGPAARKEGNRVQIELC